MHVFRFPLAIKNQRIYISHTICIYSVFMGIVKISEDMHEEIRKASSVMSRSINSQAEFWIKIGMLAELHPHLTFNEIVAHLMNTAAVSSDNVAHTVGTIRE